ncbi:hypothetical protein CRE_14441 [Caenorhabditis remanei]|uniref:Uncharacterized protein n=1 Tax=Caenorhabditis remanei TaxID=31234 RepID=E3NUN0_CAERE|nr:hypothetical protein CRE_14441 [Caenorhabditis remanei]
MVSAQSLSEYYSNNFSKCSVDNSFLASWQGLAYPSHVFQAIGFPFQMLTFWLILKKTPDNMKSIKKPLLIAHILCTLLDIHFSTLVTPYMFLPSFTYLPLGVLGLFKVPVLVQSFLMVETLIGKIKKKNLKQFFNRIPYLRFRWNRKCLVLKLPLWNALFSKFFKMIFLVLKLQTFRKIIWPQFLKVMKDQK